MRLAAGDKLWIPCEVRPGPFSDERRIQVDSDSGEWVGFVPARWIENPDRHESRVLCTVVEIAGDRFVARIPGYAALGSGFTGSVDRAKPSVSSLQA